MVDLGTLYGIGVGTGDPELMTIKGLRHLQNAPVVAYPAGINGKLGMARETVSQWLRPEQIQLALKFPYVRNREILSRAWQDAALQVWQYLQQGRNVAFVCEGDISFYSTFNYLAQTLHQQHPEVKIELVPGISSPMAAAAVLGIPLTVRHQRLAILPALYAVEELTTALDWAEVVVLMKVSSVYERVWQLLSDRQLLANAYIVERATLPDQIIYKDLRDRAHLKLSYFSLLIVQRQQSPTDM